MTKKLPKMYTRLLATGTLFCITVFLVQTVAAQTASAPASGASATAPVGAGQTADSFPVLVALKADHVSISVENLDREIEWYRRVLGFKATDHYEHPNMKSVHVENANYRIDLIKYTGSKRTPADPVYVQQGYVHLALGVPDLAAAKAAFKILDPSAKVSDTSIVLRDPEGNEIEIFAQKK